MHIPLIAEYNIKPVQLGNLNREYKKLCSPFNSYAYSVMCFPIYRAKLVALPDQEIQCVFLPDSGYQSEPYRL